MSYRRSGRTRELTSVVVHVEAPHRLTTPYDSPAEHRHILVEELRLGDEPGRVVVSHFRNLSRSAPPLASGLLMALLFRFGRPTGPRHLVRLKERVKAT